MSYDHAKHKYIFPKSRSKRLPDAVELAQKLGGFAEIDEGYEVSPSPEEVLGETFEALLKISESWKGSSFLVGANEVSKEDFLSALRTVEDETPGDTAEPVEAPVEDSAAKEPESDVEPEAEASESPPEEQAEQSKEVSLEAEEEADDEVEVVFVKPESGPKPWPIQESSTASGKKRKGCCCCCWWLPFGTAALLALILNFLGG